MNRAQGSSCLVCLILTVTLSSSAAVAASTVSRHSCGDPQRHRLSDAGEKVAGPKQSPPLIYRNRPLTEVVADLNHLGPTNLGVGPRAAKVRFSGVLVIDDQDTMVVKLTRLLPVFLHCEGEGLVLRSRP